MRISRSTGYGLLAVGYIAMHPEKDVILSQTISKEYNIPLEYLQMSHARSCHSCYRDSGQKCF